jgi:hypothetical protein
MLQHLKDKYKHLTPCTAYNADDGIRLSINFQMDTADQGTESPKAHPVTAFKSGTGDYSRPSKTLGEHFQQAEKQIEIVTKAAHQLYIGKHSGAVAAVAAADSSAVSDLDISIEIKLEELMALIKQRKELKPFSEFPVVGVVCVYGQQPSFAPCCPPGNIRKSWFSFLWKGLFD